MKAAVLRAPGSQLVIEDIPRPEPRTGEVLIEVAACGVCHSDLHVAKGEINFPTPCVLGHEISGTALALGPGVRSIRRDERVIASFLMPCGQCPSCARGRDDMCTTFFALNRLRGVYYDGETRLARADGTPLSMYSMGGLAEYAVVPATDVFALPAALPLEESCILGCAILTAYGAVKHQAEIRPGAAVAIVGVGGVGSNVVQLARLFGASTIIAVDVRPDKLATALALGATHTVDASTTDPVAAVREMTRGLGVDVALEVLGRPATVQNAIKMVRDGGRAVLVGLAAGAEAASFEITHLVRRGIQVCGSYGGRVRTDMPEILALAASGRIDVRSPVTRRFALEEAPAAFAALERGEIRGRAIVTTA